MIWGCLKIKMAIPEYYQQFCNNPNLKILDCDFYNLLSCPNTCYFVQRLKKGIIYSVMTGLERFLARKEHAKQKGFDWDEVRSPVPNNIPDEFNGEFLEWKNNYYQKLK